ncbi:hypothetical protein Tco_1324770 [Tanacetum coccineum]
MELHPSSASWERQIREGDDNNLSDNNRGMENGLHRAMQNVLRSSVVRLYQNRRMHQARQGRIITSATEAIWPSEFRFGVSLNKQIVFDRLNNHQQRGMSPMVVKMDRVPSFIGLKKVLLLGVKECLKAPYQRS